MENFMHSGRFIIELYTFRPKEASSHSSKIPPLWRSCRGSCLKTRWISSSSSLTILITSLHHTNSSDLSIVIPVISGFRCCHLTSMLCPLLCTYTWNKSNFNLKLNLFPQTHFDWSLQLRSIFHSFCKQNRLFLKISYAFWRRKRSLATETK